MINHLSITKIFGTRTLEVSFHDDLTILVGKNGTGKTTILNFISTIASGKLDELQKYEFEQVSLDYTYVGKRKTLRISKNRENNLIVYWNGSSYSIDSEDLKRGVKKRNKGGGIIYIDLIKEIVNEVNFMYLPLSRENSFFTKKIDNYYYEGNGSINFYEMNKKKIYQNGDVDNALHEINELIRENQRQMMLRFDEINQEIRKKMFQAMFYYYDDKDTSKFNDALVKKIDITELKDALYEMDLISTDFEEEIDDFFEKYEKDKSLSAAINGSNKSAEMRLLINTIQMNKLLKWNEIVQAGIGEKDSFSKPKSQFINIVNNFFSETGKKIEWNNDEGILTFISKYGNDPLPLEKMSSGEKQIIIFFAYLIFGVKEPEMGTFVIDEPEVSLHVSWQKRFIDSVVEANPQLQLIFATHSPEIIGKHIEKCVSVGRCIR